MICVDGIKIFVLKKGGKFFKRIYVFRLVLREGVKSFWYMVFIGFIWSF